MKTTDGGHKELSMVNYWLCMTNNENWFVVRQRKIWGVPRRNKMQLGRVKSGDFLVFYVKRKKKLAGIFRAVSEPSESGKKIFGSAGFAEEETFSNRVRLEPFIIPQAPIAFEKLIPKLKFITNKEKWSTHLMGRAMRMIPKDDYNKIKSSMEKISRSYNTNPAKKD